MSKAKMTVESDWSSPFPRRHHHRPSFDLEGFPRPAVTVAAPEPEISRAEAMWDEMQDYARADRIEAAEQISKLAISGVPEAYRHQAYLQAAVRQGVETALGLRELPAEQGEQ